MLVGNNKYFMRVDQKTWFFQGCYLCTKNEEILNGKLHFLCSVLVEANFFGAETRYDYDAFHKISLRNICHEVVSQSCFHPANLFWESTITVILEFWEIVQNSIFRTRQGDCFHRKKNLLEGPTIFLLISNILQICHDCVCLIWNKHSS